MVFSVVGIIMGVLLGFSLAWPIAEAAYGKLVQPAPFLAPNPKPKFKNLIKFVAHDLATNPHDWKYERVGDSIGSHGLIRHKSGRYVVLDPNGAPSKLIEPVGFDSFNGNEFGLTVAVHAWHVGEAESHLGKKPADAALEGARAALDKARAEVDAIASASPMLQRLKQRVL